MSYSLEVVSSCQKDIAKACKKNPVLNKALRNKMTEILNNPFQFKSLRYDLAGERRVHILKSFVLKYMIAEENKRVTFLFFGHHDKAYQR
jgi:YafQ family addiction module toxin component